MKQRTASSKRLLNHGRNTSTCFFGFVRISRQNVASAFRAIIVVKSSRRHEIGCRIAGNFVRQLNSPFWRALSGKQNSDIGKIQRRPAITGKHVPGVVRVRVVATSISTWLVPGGARAATGSRKPLREAQPARAQTVMAMARKWCGGRREPECGAKRSRKPVATAKK